MSDKNKKNPHDHLVPNTPLKRDMFVVGAACMALIAHYFPEDFGRGFILIFFGAMILNIFENHRS